jgi:hypothetical protein
MTRKTYPNIKEGIEIAELLGTSAEFLVMGTEQEGLTKAEQKLVNIYRKLSSTDQENAVLAMNAWAGKYEPGKSR